MKDTKSTNQFIHVCLMLLACFIITVNTSKLNAQCNTNTSICQSGVAGPFNFVNPGSTVSTCLDFWGPSVAYIMLNITTSGQLQMLIDGNSNFGFLDVAVFNIPNGVAPCTAILSNANQIGCNYASSSSGCNQFGTSFPCSASVPAPYVNAGQTLMIVVENWSGSSSSFTLSLGPTGAQTGSPNATINPAGPFCVGGTNSQLTATNQGGTWSGPGVSANGLFNPTTAGVGTHTINYSIGSAPCNSTSTTQVIVNALGSVTVTPNQSICQGGSTVLTATGATTYSWSPSTGLSGTTGPTVTANPSVTTTYTVTGTSNGCSGSAPVTVTIGPNPVVSAANNGPICVYETLELTTPTLANATYSWTGPAGFSSTDQNPTIPTISTANEGVYTLTVNVNGCTSTTTTTFTIKPDLVITIPPLAPICELADTLQLAATPLGGTWSGAGITDSVVGKFLPLSAQIGPNILTYTLSGACASVATTTIVVNSNPKPAFITDTTIGCTPLLVQLTNLTDTSLLAPNTAYNWNFGNGTTSTSSGTQTVSYETVGCFDVTLTMESYGCFGTATTPNLACVIELPDAQFISNSYAQTIFTPTFSMINQSTGAVSYSWNFGDQTTSSENNPTHSYAQEENKYTVTLFAYNSLGCVDSIKRIFTINEDLVIFVPNAFTPDGDELNNDFKPVLSSGVNESTYHMTIYNRWGEIIFETFDPEIGWDGGIGNRISTDNVYLWKITFTSNKNNDPKMYHGYLTLIK